MAKSFENPLIPHLRMRALYRALVEARALGAGLPRAGRIPKGLEACWAGTAIDLHDGDLTSDPARSPLLEHIREIGQRKTAGPPTATQIEKLRAARAVAFAGSLADRLLCAVGAAMALKAASQKAVLLAYAISPELSAADWKRILTVAGPGELPLVLVATGEPIRAVPGVIVIPVDASDVVAIYRVAQESILRARAEGGTVVIQCVRTGADPIGMLAAQLLRKGVCNQRWIDSVETGIRSV